MMPRITLRAARVNVGLTQQQAAAQLGIDKSTVQNYETGKTIPNWAIVQKISDLYKIPTDCLIFGRDSA